MISRKKSFKSEFSNLWNFDEYEIPQIEENLVPNWIFDKFD
jgi:hypothetical protein